jgi:hypothetical protein
LNKCLKTLIFICFLIFNSAHSQSLRDQVEAQKRFEFLEEMRKKDEKEIAEFEKSKNSIPRNKLSDVGIRVSCDDRRGVAGASAEDLVASRQIRDFFEETVMSDNILYSVRQCNTRNREERFCATKIGQVLMNANSIEYDLKNNPNRKDSDFEYGNIKDWLFDASSNKLIVRYGRSNVKLLEMSCVKARWLD